MRLLEASPRLDEQSKIKKSKTKNRYQDLRTGDKFSGFQTISRGLRPRETIQLRKSYDILTSCMNAILKGGIATLHRRATIHTGSPLLTLPRL